MPPVPGGVPPHESYDQLEAEPEGVRWKPAAQQRKGTRVFYSIGNFYKLIRVLETGDVTYFKLKDEKPATPAAQIDAEDPKAPRQPNLSVGRKVWFVNDAGLWSLFEVTAKSGSRGRHVTFKSVTGWDATRTVEWGEAVIEFPIGSPLFARLRHLSARRP